MKKIVKIFKGGGINRNRNHKYVVLKGGGDPTHHDPKQPHPTKSANVTPHGHTTNGPHTGKPKKKTKEEIHEAKKAKKLAKKTKKQANLNVKIRKKEESLDAKGKHSSNSKKLKKLRAKESKRNESMIALQPKVIPVISAPVVKIEAPPMEIKHEAHHDAVIVGMIHSEHPPPHLGMGPPHLGMGPPHLGMGPPHLGQPHSLGHLNAPPVYSLHPQGHQNQGPPMYAPHPPGHLNAPPAYAPHPSVPASVPAPIAIPKYNQATLERKIDKHEGIVQNMQRKQTKYAKQKSNAQQRITEVEAAIAKNNKAMANKAAKKTGKKKNMVEKV